MKIFEALLQGYVALTVLLSQGASTQAEASVQENQDTEHNLDPFAHTYSNHYTKEIKPSDGVRFSSGWTKVMCLANEQGTYHNRNIDFNENAHFSINITAPEGLKYQFQTPRSIPQFIDQPPKQFEYAQLKTRWKDVLAMQISNISYCPAESNGNEHIKVTIQSTSKYRVCRLDLNVPLYQKFNLSPPKDNLNQSTLIVNDHKKTLSEHTVENGFRRHKNHTITIKSNAKMVDLTIDNSQVIVNHRLYQFGLHPVPYTLLVITHESCSQPRSMNGTFYINVEKKTPIKKAYCYRRSLSPIDWLRIPKIQFQQEQNWANANASFTLMLNGVTLKEGLSYDQFKRGIKPIVLNDSIEQLIKRMRDTLNRIPHMATKRDFLPYMRFIENSHNAYSLESNIIYNNQNSWHDIYDIKPSKFDRSQLKSLKKKWFDLAKSSRVCYRQSNQKKQSSQKWPPRYIAYLSTMIDWYQSNINAINFIITIILYSSQNREFLKEYISKIDSINFFITNIKLHQEKKSAMPTSSILNTLVLKDLQHEPNSVNMILILFQNSRYLSKLEALRLLTENFNLPRHEQLHVFNQSLQRIRMLVIWLRDIKLSFLQGNIQLIEKSEALKDENYILKNTVCDIKSILSILNVKGKVNQIKVLMDIMGLNNENNPLLMLLYAIKFLKKEDEPESLKLKKVNPKKLMESVASNTILRKLPSHSTSKECVQRTFYSGFPIGNSSLVYYNKNANGKDKTHGFTNETVKFSTWLWTTIHTHYKIGKKGIIAPTLLNKLLLVYTTTTLNKRLGLYYQNTGFAD